MTTRGASTRGSGAGRRRRRMPLIRCRVTRVGVERLRGGGPEQTQPTAPRGASCAACQRSRKGRPPPQPLRAALRLAHLREGRVARARELGRLPAAPARCRARRLSSTAASASNGWFEVGHRNTSAAGAPGGTLRAARGRTPWAASRQKPCARQSAAPMRRRGKRAGWHALVAADEAEASPMRQADQARLSVKSAAASRFRHAYLETHRSEIRHHADVDGLAPPAAAPSSCRRGRAGWRAGRAGAHRSRCGAQRRAAPPELPRVAASPSRAAVRAPCGRTGPPHAANGDAAPAHGYVSTG